jgi:hypothetical protein
MSSAGNDPVPYDESAWERIVADLSDELPQAPVAPPPAPVEDPEDTFVPPEPAPLPRLDLITRLAWGATLGGPLLLFLGVLAPGVVSPGFVVLGIAAFVAGFLTLVLRDPHEPEDGWDDGSVV